MGVSKRGEKLVIDFRCYLPDNRRVRCVEREGLDNPKNKARVNKKWKAVQYHIDSNTFDYLKFFPNGTKAKHFRKPKTKITFSEYWEEWINTLSIGRGSSDNRQYTFENHLKPYFGGYLLSDITDDEIKVFRKKLLSSGLKASTVNNHIKTLCMPLKKAVRKGLIDLYPCDGIGRLKEDKPEIDPFSFEELQHWLDYLKKKDPEWYDLILFWSRTGIRPGELYALKWERVDFFNNQIMIRANRQYYGGDGPTKTESSNRDVDLRPSVVDALKRQQGRTGLMNKYIFMNHRHNQWNATVFREQFKIRLRLAKLKLRPPKQMRHTFATLHIHAGESISWVSEMLGHTNVEITLKRYNRFIPNLTREDGSAFENMMNNLKRKI